MRRPRHTGLTSGDRRGRRRDPGRTRSADDPRDGPRHRAPGCFPDAPPHGAREHPGPERPAHDPAGGGRGRGAGSPGRHDDSAYDDLSPEGRAAHDTQNCAQIPGKRKGSCNEPHRRCKEHGATATSAAGVALTCRTASWDGRLRRPAAGE
ncbi:hypothetical protein [Kitasatospora sp. NPDC002965]|uniref:hypothetical protein n=1 Tax=Kitasatospora sp. NPDC002965 TaxID=3154775 RepID=UPI0033AD8393